MTACCFYSIDGKLVDKTWPLRIRFIHKLFTLSLFPSQQLFENCAGDSTYNTCTCTQKTYLLAFCLHLLWVITYLKVYIYYCSCLHHWYFNEFKLSELACAIILFLFAICECLLHKWVFLIYFLLHWLWLNIIVERLDRWLQGSTILYLLLSQPQHCSWQRLTSK